MLCDLATRSLVAAPSIKVSEFVQGGRPGQCLEQDYAASP